MLHEFRHGARSFDFDSFSAGHGNNNAVRIRTTGSGTVVVRESLAVTKILPDQGRIAVNVTDEHFVLLIFNACHQMTTVRIVPPAPGREDNIGQHAVAVVLVPRPLAVVILRADDP